MRFTKWQKCFIWSHLYDEVKIVSICSYFKEFSVSLTTWVILDSLSITQLQTRALARQIDIGQRMWRIILQISYLWQLAGMHVMLKCSLNDGFVSNTMLNFQAVQMYFMTVMPMYTEIRAKFLPFKTEETRCQDQSVRSSLWEGELVLCLGGSLSRDKKFIKLTNWLNFLKHFGSEGIKKGWVEIRDQMAIW